jgi:hypothetical protein
LGQQRQQEHDLETWLLYKQMYIEPPTYSLRFDVVNAWFGFNC